MSAYHTRCALHADDRPRPTPYIRASFSTLEPDKVCEALGRLKDVLLVAQSQTSQ